MKNAIIGFLVSIIGLMAYSAYATIKTVTAQSSANYARPCIPEAGAAQEITATTGASDASTQLNIGRYQLKCDQAVYFRTGSTAPTAASGDMKIPADYIYEFATDGDHDFIAAKNITTSGSCWLLECL